MKQLELAVFFQDDLMRPTYLALKRFFKWNLALTRPISLSKLILHLKEFQYIRYLTCDESNESNNLTYIKSISSSSKMIPTNSKNRKNTTTWPTKNGIQNGSFNARNSCNSNGGRIIGTKLQSWGMLESV